MAGGLGQGLEAGRAGAGRGDWGQAYEQPPLRKEVSEALHPHAAAESMDARDPGRQA
ncbi:hypothetical protein ACFWG6_33790 [Streptomyces erythrochromogenes]|uniref:hypothetical protein n=1 Tax=Streptomyces erythrochromogenes TaxID=285574 RepID=UPI003630A246